MWIKNDLILIDDKNKTLVEVYKKKAQEIITRAEYMKKKIIDPEAKEEKIEIKQTKEEITGEKNLFDQIKGEEYNLPWDQIIGLEDCKEILKESFK